MVGDVIFVEGTGLVSKMIKWVTGGKWSHVAMFVTDDTLIETEWNTKCRLINIHDTDYLTKNHEIIHVPMDNKDLEMLNLAIYPFLGSKYDYWLLVKLFFKYIFKFKVRNNSPQKVVCSELVAHILLILGHFNLYDFGLANTSPSELYNILKCAYGGEH